VLAHGANNHGGATSLRSFLLERGGYPKAVADDSIQCVADVHAVLGEGPIWVAREEALYWLDIQGRTIFRLKENGELDRWPTPFRVGSIAPRAKGGFIAGTDQGIAEIDLATGHLQILLNPEEKLPGNRFNDGKVDRQGRFWAGTMDDREREATGTLYRIDADLGCTVVDKGYRVTNGPAFSPHGGTMYENDSATRVTYAFDFDEDGNAANRRVFLKFDEGDGYPDGMTVDSEGCLWIAFWDGWCIRRYSPTESSCAPSRCRSSAPPAVPSGGRISTGSTSPRRAGISMKRPWRCNQRPGDCLC
jgi:sugar lactone lactonase YvrE